MKKEFLEIYSKYKMILFPVFVGIAGIALVLLVIFPQFNEYTKEQEDLAAAKDRFALLDQKAKDLQAINIQNIEDKLTTAVNAFPTERDFPGIIGLVQRLAAESNLNLTALQIGQAQGAIKGSAPSFSVRFEVSGPKTSVNILLDKIEKSYRVVKVTTIDIAAQSQTDVSANITIDSYYEPTPNALGAVDAPLSKITPDEEKVLSDLAAAAPPPVQEEDLSGIPRGKVNPFD